MSIRYKLLFFFLVQHIFFLAITLFFVQFFIRPHHLEMEHLSAKERISQVRYIFKSEMEHLKLLNIDWAVWDDTYNYLSNRNSDYIQSNFHENILESTDLSRIEIFDASGKSVYCVEDERIGAGSLIGPEGYLKKKFLSGPKSARKKTRHGIIALDKGFALVSLSPVLRGNGSGPAAGILLMLRSVEKKMIEKINKSTHTEVSLLPIESLSSFQESEGFYTQREDKEHLKVSSVLKGLDEKASVGVEIALKRELVIESEKLILYLFIFGGVLGIVSFFISLRLLRKEVVKPLSDLGKHIVNLRREKSYIKCPLENREDEIGILAREFNTLLESLDSTNQTLSTVAHVDALTGLANRLDLEERFEIEKRLSYRETKEFSILILDIDCFKKYNDTYGHVKGDEVLSRVAQSIKDSLARPRDYAARYGGEEFLVILPKTQVMGSITVAKRILENVEALQIEHESSLLDKKLISVSIGCLTIIAHKDQDQDSIINMADEALYTAKNRGRDRYFVYNKEGVSTESDRESFFSLAATKKENSLS